MMDIVEATTLNERSRNLRPQDVFLQQNMQTNDVLIVSVGGNDVALFPTPCTILSLGCLLGCMPRSCVEHGQSCCVIPVSEYAYISVKQNIAYRLDHELLCF